VLTKFILSEISMEWRGQSQFSSAYDVENSCFRRYSELMKDFGNQSLIIKPFDWNEEHIKYQNAALQEFGELSKNFKLHDVQDARSSLLNVSIICLDNE
jgi:hypothetical protein